jgi:hypothetical protein
VTPDSPDRSAAAAEAARRLWTGVAGNVTGPDQVAGGAARLFTRLRAGLGRWVGVEGYCALLDRAIALVRAEYPAVDSLSCQREDEPLTIETVRAHGSREVAAGVVALLAALIDLLGRIVGDEIAVRLVEQTADPAPDGAARTTGTQGGRDG